LIKVRRALRLPVVFAIHDPNGTYWLNTAVALTSVVHHAKCPVSIFIIHDATLAEAARRRLKEVADASGAPCTFIVRSLPVGLNPQLLGKFSPASAFRLEIPAIFPHEELVIYLDSDLVANGVDVGELASSVPSGAPIAAVPDPFFSRARSHADHLRELGISPDRYFNSGVLAMRPRLLRPTLLQEFVDFVRVSARLVHPDQDFLNLQFSDVVHLLDERFNAPIGVIDRRAIKPLSFYDGKIIHYVGDMKPLRGLLSPAFLPFLTHSFLVPEIWSGKFYSPTMYLFPVEGLPHQLRGKRIDQDPAAEMFYSRLAKTDERLTEELRSFVQQLASCRVYPNFVGPMELGWRSPEGWNAVVAVVEMDGGVRIDGPDAATSSQRHREGADRYKSTLAELSPEFAGSHPPKLSLSKLLDNQDAWKAAIETYLHELS
jgi:lipopolysaccharide biosynthesis glycosyltransferase